MSPFQKCCYMKTAQVWFSIFCSRVSQPWPVDILDQIILCCGELSRVLWAVWKHSWLLLTKWKSTLSIVVTTKNVTRHCQKSPGAGYYPQLGTTTLSAYIRTDYDLYLWYHLPLYLFCTLQSCLIISLKSSDNWQELFTLE